MPRYQRQSSYVLLCAALTSLITLPAVAQDGTRPYRSPVREAYQPRIAESADSAASRANAPVRVAILGTVAQPGTYACPPGTDVGQLLAAVGGLTPERSGGWTLIRGGRNQGTLAFDLGQPDFAQFGELRDGDVAVFHAQRGVRNAHYQWTHADQRANGPQSSVQNAAREQSAFIACLGLAPHPVVLSVPVQQANETALLIGMLEMNPAAVRAGVRPLLKTTSHESEALPDGTVLAFDRHVLKPDDITSKLQFPLPSPLPQVPEPTDDAATEAPAILPSATDAVSPGSSPEEVRPLPMPVSQRVVTPAGDVQVVPNGHLLTQPLPNLAFAYDRVWNSAVDVNGQSQTVAAETTASAPWRSAPVVRGPQSDLAAESRSTEATAVPATMPAGSLTLAETAPSTVVIPPTTIRPTTAAIQPRTAARAASAAATSPAEGSLHIGTIIGILVASTLCVLASGLAIRELRKRRGLVAHAPQARPEFTVRPQELSAPLTALQELLENRLPIIEEPATHDQPLQLHGAVIGQRRLRVDAAHRDVPAPHFARVPTAAETKRQERLQKHLAAATSVKKHRPQAQPAALSPAPVSTPSAPVGRSVRYDIVQPEPQAGQSPTNTRRPHAPDRAPAAHGDLLARVLSSLREET